MTYLELKELLKSKKYLTSDSFQTPDITYIYLDNDVIMFSDFGVVYPFHLGIFYEAVFREVQRKYVIHYENKR